MFITTSIKSGTASSGRTTSPSGTSFTSNDETVIWRQSEADQKPESLQRVAPHQWPEPDRRPQLDRRSEQGRHQRHPKELSNALETDLNEVHEEQNSFSR